jgi:hypothetical protein
MKGRRNKTNNKNNSFMNIPVDLDLDAIKRSQQIVDGIVNNYGSLNAINQATSLLSIFAEMRPNIVRSIANAWEPMLKVQETLKTSAQQIREGFSMIQSQNSLMLQSVANSVKLLNSWIEQNREVFSDMAKKFKEVQAQYHIAEQEVLPCLRKYKWFVTPSMPADFIFEIYSIAQKKGNQSKAVNKLFYELVLGDNGKTLDELLNNWHGRIDHDRLKIISDVFKIIKISLISKNLNIANVVVPTLIVQIDGIILDFLKNNKLNTGNYKERKIDFEFNKSLVLPHYYESLINDVLLEVLFQEAKTGMPLKNPYQFNRHKIVHGENKAYGRRDYLVRTILILDYLAHIKKSKDKTNY